MFFIFVFDESQLSSLFSTSGDGISVAAVLCVIAVTVPLVLLTLLCICWKQTLVLNPAVKQPSAVVTDAPLSSSQLHLTTTGDEAKIEEDANHNTSKRESAELNIALTDSTLPHSQDSPQHDLLSTSPEGLSVMHSSPGLPPRNPQRLISAQSSNPANPGQPGILPLTPAGPTSLPPPADGTSPVEDRPTTDNPTDNPSSDPGLYSVIAEDSQPVTVPDLAEDADYAEVDFQERSNLQIGETTAAATDRQYDYIDLKSVKTVDIGCVSYAEVNRNGATGDNKPANEVPWYAKVDKSGNRHSFCIELLGNASGDNGDPGAKVISSPQRKICGSHDELYTAVNKAEAVRTDRREDRSSPSRLQAENFLSADGCGTSDGSRAPGSAADFCPPVPSKNFEEPGYSMIRDESKKDSEDPDYSSIVDEPKENSDDPDYSVIEDVRAGALPRPESGPENSESAAKEPLYEDVRFDAQSCPATTSPNAPGPADAA